MCTSLLRKKQLSALRSGERKPICPKKLKLFAPFGDQKTVIVATRICLTELSTSTAACCDTKNYDSMCSQIFFPQRGSKHNVRPSYFNIKRYMKPLQPVLRTTAGASLIVSLHHNGLEATNACLVLRLHRQGGNTRDRLFQHLPFDYWNR